MGTVAGETGNQRQETVPKRNRRSWLGWGLVLVVGAGCSMYVAQLRAQVRRLTELERSLTERMLAQRAEVAALEAVQIPAPEPPRVPASDEDKININTSTFDALASLPGVGTVTARAIVAYREAHGDFHRLQDLCKVKGIGDEKLRWLENLVTV